MNGLSILLVSTAFLAAGYFLYSRIVALILGVDAKRPTPAHTMRDGVDYVPAHPAVLFGHHFATIAGAGPIVGPVLAAKFGWASVLAWVLLGCVFIGAAHDMIALFLSVRHGGRSIGTVIGDILGPRGRSLFLLFSWSALILVVGEFTRLVAATFTANPGIATASLLFIAEAVAFGVCVNRFKVGVLAASLVFVPLMFASVWIGGMIPLNVAGMLEGRVSDPAQTARVIWTLAILAYCYLASTLPVWILLQPRDYLNSYLLYAMMALGFAGVFIAQPEVQMSAFRGFSDSGGETVFPFLFVTVACGACSGFHALVASGTTSKQISSEAHIRPVGYGAMLLEGVLAVLALVGVAAWSDATYAAEAANATPVELFAKSIGGFCTRIFTIFGCSPGEAAECAKSSGGFILLAVSAFLMTSVDSATRLARFTWQEMFPLPEPFQVDRGAVPPPRAGRKFLNGKHLGTAVATGLAAVLLVGDPDTAKSLWTTFASANQMLAALTLLAATLWFVRHRKPAAFAFLPMIFMMAVSVYALVLLFAGSLENGDFVKTAALGFLISLAAGLIFHALGKLFASERSGGESAHGAEGHGGHRHHHHHHHHHSR